jgi:hypothetical protein
MLFDVISKHPFRISFGGSGLIQLDRYGGIVLFAVVPLPVLQVIYCGY